jgi:hypothetical protein
LTQQVDKVIREWELNDTFDPDLASNTFRRWTLTTPWAPYALIGSFFVFAFGVFLGLLALMRPSMACQSGTKARSWVKIVLWSLFFAAVCALAASAAHWLEISSKQKRLSIA